MIIDAEFSSLLVPLTKEERGFLEESILREGCRDALVTWEEILIDGHNRHEICTANDLPFSIMEKEFPDRQAVKAWIIKNQLGRRNLTPEKFAYLIGKQYEERKKEEGRPKKLDQNDPVSSGATDEVIADEYKISAPTVIRAAAFSKAIDSIASAVGEEAKEKILNREIDMTRAEVIEVGSLPPIEQKKVLDELEREDGKTWRVRLERRELNIPKPHPAPPLPEGQFNIILADPPWSYEFSETDSRKIENKYPVMDLEDIKGVKVPSADDAILFLWATAPKMEEALQVLSAWGFAYRTGAVWDKEVIGMGYWFRGQHEHLLVGVKGEVNAPAPDCRFSSVVRERRSEHSKKPEVVYEMLEKMFPNGKYLELFARDNSRPNWTTWGNQA